MSSIRIALIALLGLGACGEPATGGKGGGNGGGGATSDEDFMRDDSVRVIWPTNGETVEGHFKLEYQVGGLVEKFRLEANGSLLYTVQVQAEDGHDKIWLDLDNGRWDITMVGLGSDGLELSDTTVTVRVADEEDTWVTITSPHDGQEVKNPVTFTVEASDDIDLVEILADGWSVGTLEPGGLLTSDFTGTGYERAIEARALDEEGEVVAMDDIDITVTPSEDPDESDFNTTLLAYIDSYPLDGSHGYYWPADDGVWYGTTRDVYYDGELWSPADPQGRCYCVGLTMEVFLRSFQEIDLETGGTGRVNDIDQDEFPEFVKDWFVRDLWGRGIVDAMENYGIGDEVSDWAEARPGDILQFWRHSGSGHNAYFMDWETDEEGTITGVTYWSTQGSTDGIDLNTEYFGSSGSRIDPSYFFLGRVRMPEDWEPW